MIDIMNRVAADIFTLANCSRAGLYDSKNMFLVKSITLPKYYDENFEYANKLDPLDFGLTEEFISKSYDLVSTCN